MIDTRIVLGRECAILASWCAPMDAAIDKASAEKRQIQAQIAALNERLHRIDTFIALHKEFSGGAGESGSGSLPLPPPLPQLPPISPPNVLPHRRKSIPDQVFDLLQDGRPRKTDRLLELLRVSGTEVGGEGRRKIINLSSTLSRDSRFENDRQTGWTIKKANPPSVPADDGFDDHL